MREFYDKDNKLYDFFNEIQKMQNQLIIDGLKNKGFTFPNDDSLYNFVGNYVNCEDNKLLKVKTYYVKGIPFLLEKYAANPLWEGDKVYLQNNYEFL